MEAPQFPMRINRYLAQKGFSTRKGADDLIRRGLVRINGKVAHLGDRVNANDAVSVAQTKRDTKLFSYVLYYKPQGLVTHSPRKGERSIDTTTKFRGLFPVGRLDKDSEGLIMLTNDGRVTERLLHPRFVHEKEYEVIVREMIRPMVRKILLGGVTDAGEKLRAKGVSIVGPHTMRIILTEGKKHQVRRMLAHARLTIESLKRIRIMNMTLGTLKPGESRALTREEAQHFTASIGLPT